MSSDQRVYTVSDSHWTGISCSCCNGTRAKRGKKHHAKMPQSAADVIKKAREKLDQMHGPPGERLREAEKGFDKMLDDAVQTAKARQSKT